MKYLRVIPLILMILGILIGIVGYAILSYKVASLICMLFVIIGVTGILTVPLFDK